MRSVSLYNIWFPPRLLLFKVMDISNPCEFQAIFICNSTGIFSFLQNLDSMPHLKSEKGKKGGRGGEGHVVSGGECACSPCTVVGRSSSDLDVLKAWLRNGWLEQPPSMSFKNCSRSPSLPSPPLPHNLGDCPPRHKASWGGGIAFNNVGQHQAHSWEYNPTVPCAWEESSIDCSGGACGSPPRHQKGIIDDDDDTWTPFLPSLILN